MMSSVVVMGDHSVADRRREALDPITLKISIGERLRSPLRDTRISRAQGNRDVSEQEATREAFASCDRRSSGHFLPQCKREDASLNHAILDSPTRFAAAAHARLLSGSRGTTTCRSSRMVASNEDHEEGRRRRDRLQRGLHVPNDTRFAKRRGSSPHDSPWSYERLKSIPALPAELDRVLARKSYDLIQLRVSGTWVDSKFRRPGARPAICPTAQLE